MPTPIEERIDAIFPGAGAVPAEHRPEPVEQTEFLVGGELRRWDGPREDVLSPVCLARGGAVEQERIGSFPRLTAEEAGAAPR